MILIRRVEETIADMVATGEARCPCHLAIGQEATAVAVAAHLTPKDRIFGCHRSHAHYLALGGDPYTLFAEVLGRVTGCAGGMGGSMHLYDPAHGLLGTVPIVAATIPIATGAALAAKMDNGTDIAIAFFGDGATEEGVFHESLNLASVMGLPIIFVCENNLFSSHLHISLRQPYNSITRYAVAHGISAKVVDGNDVVAISRAASELVQQARDNRKPAMLETVTYRWRGHVGHREDLDVGVKRSEELILWKYRDPIRRLAQALENQSFLSPEALTAMHDELDSLTSEALEEARKAPYPADSQLLDCVYSHNFHHPFHTPGI
jgi:pyruvate dehydrogenase E1 component alpha subunit